MSSRVIGANFMPSLKPNDKPRFFKTVSETPFLMSKQYAWNLLGKSCRNLSMWKNQQTKTFVRHSNVNPPPEAAPLPSGSPSGSLRTWIVGIVLTFVLPFIARKWGPLLLLKNKVDQKIEMAENVVKSIENIAEKADKVIDSITDNLPKDSELKKKLEFVDEIVEGVAKSAHVADQFINQVEEAEGQLESLITHENSNGGEIPHEDEDKSDHKDQEIINEQQENNNNTN